MPLKIRLKANEKIIVNGVVIENGNKRTNLVIANQANVLRGKDVLLGEQVDTPTKKLYFLIQQHLIGGEDEKLKDRIYHLMTELFSIFSSSDVVNSVVLSMNEFSAYDFYKSLAALRPVLEYEEKIMQK